VNFVSHIHLITQLLHRHDICIDLLKSVLGSIAILKAINIFCKHVKPPESLYCLVAFLLYACLCKNICSLVILSRDVIISDLDTNHAQHLHLSLDLLEASRILDWPSSFADKYALPIHPPIFKMLTHSLYNIA
jgi:hypothetical protein